MPIADDHARQSSLDTPQTNLTPIAPPASTYAPPASGYGQFDPYAPPATGGFGGTAFGGGGYPGFGGGLGPGVTTIGPPTPNGPPMSAPAAGGSGFFNRFFAQPDAPPPPSLSPNFGLPASGPVYGPSSPPYDNPSVYGPPVATPSAGSIYPSTAYPSSAYPSATPNTLFPSGILSGNGYNFSDPVYSAYRLLRGPKLRTTYIGPGNSANDLNITNIDTSVVFAFPNFLYMAQPLYVAPSFSLSLWDGPESSTGADLPPNAYGAFLDTGWQSDPNQMFGTELGVRVGVFSDFNTYNSNSWRVMGKGLFQFRLTPATTVKGGVYYLDRNKIKLLPAFGVLCQPNPYTRWNIFFPEPKYAHYCSTIGTKDVWWYTSGEYGGGNWTITRESGNEDSVDLNDIRVMTGFEWGDSNAIRAGLRTAFVEIGYVFDREIDYRYEPSDNIDPGNAFLFSAGFGY